MPNRLTIDVYERHNLRTGVLDYAVDVYDDYAHTTLIFAEKSEISDDDMELLTAVIRVVNHHDEHGTSSDMVGGMLDHLREHEQAINIGGQRYEWSEIRETVRYSFRNLYECPKCGYTSWDDDCGNCPDCVEEIQLQFVTEEHFEL